MAQGILRRLGRLAILTRQSNSPAFLARYASTGANAEPETPSKASEPSPGSSSVPAAEAPVTSTGYVEVAYAPRRVMPLPEDKPEMEMVEVELPGGEASAPKKVLRRVFKPALVDYGVPLPKIIRNEPNKPMDPVSLVEGIQLVKSNARAKFDETVEVHIRVNVDPKRTDQVVRGAVTLPHGSGKAVRVAVFADGAAAQEALAAGADIVGSDDLIAKILASGGKLDFDKCIAIPSVMPKLGKVARILGPRGLMPNPKVGSVTGKVGEAVKAAKQGRVDFKCDKQGIIHAGLGKVSFTEDALFQNISAFAGAVLAAKPAGLKKSSKYLGFFHKFFITSTMGKGIPISIQSVALASDEFMKAHEASL